MYETAVGLHGCSDWFNDVMDPKKTNQVFDLPIASFPQKVPKPEKETIAPVSSFPQDGDGTCGVSALSGAFFYVFDINF